MIFIYNVPLYGTVAPGVTTRWIAFAELQKLGNGTVVVIDNNKQILSVQPGGQWETRAPGTPGVPGQYEMATVNGASVIVFNPNGGNGPVYPYPIINTEV